MRKLADSLSPFAAFLARHSAIIALALFAVVGVSVLDDYGIGFDTSTHMATGIASFNYILGDGDALLDEDDHNRLYGVAFQTPLIAVERLLRLEDSRDLYLSRHLLAHLLFLAAGFFAWLLAYRLFGSRLVALLAMLIFLLHPRIYAHSFFNSKDVPFLSMFMIALYLTHRAFRRDTAWAFALCGVGAGLLANFRIMGVMLFPAVLGMLALDAFYAMKRGDGSVKRSFANMLAFSAVSAATLYAVWPGMWREPTLAFEAFATLSNHPENTPPMLFRGEFVAWPNLPWDYFPTWMLITTPPVALALAAVGIAFAARLCAADWRAALANSTARFWLLAVACLILPVAAVVALNANTYNGWRHVYFLYAPLCVLAAFGLRALAAIPKPRLRAAAFAFAALGLAAAAAQIVSLHPVQSEYFNVLVDKASVSDRWDMNYWRVSRKQALDALLKIQPSGRILVSGDHHVIQDIRLFPPDDRRRFVNAPRFPSFRVFTGVVRDFEYPVVWKREVYGVAVGAVLDSRAESEAAVQDAYAAASASKRAASAGGFDMYADGGKLAYVNEDCGEEDARGIFELSIFPVDPSDLPQTARDENLEYESRDFPFYDYGALLDGKCVVVPNMPEYPISHVETGQTMPGESRLWSARILYGGHRERYERARSSLSGEPAARSGFDIWLNDGTLTYIKENCDEEDARGRFFLSVFPADPSDLPQTAQDAEREHQSLNFDFARYGAIVDGGCVIIRNLPGYAISRIETGQWLPGEGELWSAEIAVGD